jgi:LPXTG-motif cell wall-anchored protein
VAVLLVLGQGVTTAARAADQNIPTRIQVSVSYLDTEGRAPKSGTCDTCVPNPWCGSPGVQFIGASTNYNGNSTDPKNCQAGDWDTGGILVNNTGTSPVTFTNLTVFFPLPSAGGTVVPTCKAEMRPITIRVWFGQQYYWDNPADPAYDGGPITVAPGSSAIFAGTSSDNSYTCPTGNYPSTGLKNGTYDFDSSDAYYLDGCVPTTDQSSAPQITFSAIGYAATTYIDVGHTLDTGGIDTGNCAPTATDPQWGHESLGWRPVNDPCGEACPTNQVGLSTSSFTNTTTTPSAGVNSATLYLLAGVVVVLLVAAGYLLLGRRRAVS